MINNPPTSPELQCSLSKNAVLTLSRHSQKTGLLIVAKQFFENWEEQVQQYVVCSMVIKQGGYAVRVAFCASDIDGILTGGIETLLSKS